MPHLDLTRLDGRDAAGTGGVVTRRERGCRHPRRDQNEDDEAEAESPHLGLLGSLTSR